MEISIILLLLISIPMILTFLKKPYLPLFVLILWFFGGITLQSSPSARKSKKKKPLTTTSTEKKTAPDRMLLQKYAQKVFLANCIANGVSFCCLLGSFIAVVKAQAKKDTAVKVLFQKVLNAFVPQFLWGLGAILVSLLGDILISKLIPLPSTKPFALRYKKQMMKKKWLIDGLTPVGCILTALITLIVGFFSGDKDPEGNLFIVGSFLLAATPYINLIIGFSTSLTFYLKTLLMGKSKTKKRTRTLRQ